MLFAPFDLTLLIVYFIYGLAFFGMGLIMALEAGRSPALLEARALRPLAAFGILHGTHEWFESYLLQAQAAGTSFPGWLPWLRLSLLAGSFLLLFIYGIQTFRLPAYRPLLGMRIGLGVLLLYASLIVVSALSASFRAPVAWTSLLDGLARYLLAVPGIALSVLALRFYAVQAKSRGERRLARAFSAAAWGFSLYGLAQFFVHPVDVFPASVLNTETFRAAVGFPVQAVRAFAAVVITLGLLQGTRAVEQIRRGELDAAQQARLDALQQVQTEMTRREQLRRELLRHTVQAQEDERARIARELHDETSQVLSALSLDLATLQSRLAAQPEGSQIVERLQSLSRQMSQGLYRLVHDLRPAQLDDLGLVAALQYLQDEKREKGLNVELQVSGSACPTDPIHETVLFRVAQEALNNTLRHAGTEAAILQLEYRSSEILLRVVDDGRGFDPSQEFDPPRGWGLAGMRERVEAIGGRLGIDSRPGGGTRVEATVPLERTAALEKGEAR